MSAESETSSNVMAEAMNGDGATPLVSVIVPVYGVERYLDACVEGPLPCDVRCVDGEG